MCNVCMPSAARFIATRREQISASSPAIPTPTSTMSNDPPQDKANAPAQATGSHSVAQRIARLQEELNRMRQTQPEASSVRQSGSGALRIPSLPVGGSSHDENDSSDDDTPPRQAGVAAPQQKSTTIQKPSKGATASSLPRKRKAILSARKDDVRAQLPKGTTLHIPCSAFPKHKPTPEGYWSGIVQTNRPTGAPTMVKVC